jgi:hypothetical protein
MLCDDLQHFERRLYLSDIGSVKHGLHQQILIGMFHVLLILVDQKEDHPMRQTSPQRSKHRKKHIPKAT